TAESVGEYRGSGLPRRETDADLAQASRISCVIRGQESICQGPQRNAVVEKTVAAAKHRFTRRERRPRETAAGRDVVRIRVNSSQELKIITQAQVQSEAGIYLPLILSIEAYVRIFLINSAVREGLSKAGIVIGPREKVRQRRK